MDIKNVTKTINAGLEKIAAGPSPHSATAGRAGEPGEPAGSLSKILVGSMSVLEEYYFPPELIGGTCPRVAGEEEDIVWNAAAEACDSERVHIVWQATDNKLWFVAVRSADLASHTHSWCPFAALLPGMKDALPAPVCYTYYGDDMATMMTVTADSLQIYRGTNLVVRAKAERTARELGNAAVVNLVPDRILALNPAPWYSLSLFEDRARRVLAAASVIAALGLIGIAVVIWLFSSMTLLASRNDLSRTMARTQKKTMELVTTAEQLRSSPLREQLAKFAGLNDGLLAVNGYLEIYKLEKDTPRWRALVPPNVTADRINELGGKMIETNQSGAIIGNAAEIEFENSASKGKGKR